jgi:hypothetical protein
MISASAVSLAHRCLRRAAFKYGSDLAPEPEPETEALSTGKQGHTILEAYQKEGTAPPQTPLGDLCRKGLPWLPRPLSANAEGKFEVQISGVPYLGFIDLETNNYRVVPGIKDGGIPAIIDYKFSRAPETYGVQEPKDFLRDPQALLYAAWSFVKYGQSHVFLRWLKFKTQGPPKAYPVDAVLTRAEVTRAFGRIVHPQASTLLRIRDRNNDPNAYAPNFEACNDFGRQCPYFRHCKRSSMTLLDEMRALVAQPTPEKANTNGAPEGSINPPPIMTAPATTRTWTPEPLARVLLEELGAAMTKAAARL